MSDIRFNQWLHNSGTGGISQDSAGHVGIGTTVPTHINALTNNNSILHVGIVSCNTLNAASKIEGSIDDWIIHQDDTNTKFGFPTTDTFTVETAGSERLRIKSDGKVGIGTDNPGRALEVYDATHGQLRIRGGGGGSDSNRKADLNFFASGARSWIIRADAADAALKIIDESGSDANRFHIDTSGRVGIGTGAPVGKYLTVGPLQETGTDRAALSIKTVSNSLGNGEAAIQIEEASGTEGYFLGVDSSGGLSFTNSGASHQTLYLGDDNKVGIGTDIPDETLELFKASGTNLVKISTQANSTIGLLLEKTGSTTQSWKIADGQTANGTLEIYDATESETRLAIDGSGRVIIGQHSHGGGGTLVVVGNSNTPNAYGCAAFCKIAANPTSGQTLAQLRFSAGSGGTNRAAEISVQADSNWNDGTSQESKMIFKVASSGGGNTAGNALMTLKGTGDVEINRGNLVIANTKGIDFSATSDGAGTDSSELLDDYEVGTFTPYFGAYGGSNGSFTYNNQNGSYVKTGNLVSCTFFLRATNMSALPAGSYVTIYGFPYTNASGAAREGATLNVNWWSCDGGGITSGNNPMGFMNGNNTRVLMGQQSNTGVSGISPTMFHGASTGTKAGYIYASIVYHTA